MTGRRMTNLLVGSSMGTVVDRQHDLVGHQVA